MWETPYEDYGWGGPARGGRFRGGRGGGGGFREGRGRSPSRGFRGSRGRGRGSRGSRGRGSRGPPRRGGVKREAPGGPMGGTPKKRPTTNAPGLGICNLIILSEVPSADAQHEFVCQEFTQLNSTLRVGRHSYALSMQLSKHGDKPAKLEFEVAQSNLEFFRMEGESPVDFKQDMVMSDSQPTEDQPDSEAQDPKEGQDKENDTEPGSSENLTQVGKEQQDQMDEEPDQTEQDKTQGVQGSDQMEDGDEGQQEGQDVDQESSESKKEDQPVAERKKKYSALRKDVHVVHSRLIFVVKEPITVTTPCDEIIDSDALSNARVFIVEFRDRKGQVYVPKEYLQEVIASGPLLGFDKSDVWPMSGPGSVEEVVKKFTKTAYELVVKGFTLTACSKCGEQRMNRAMEHHMRTDCGVLETSCSHCRKPMTKNELKEHRRDCDYLPLRCDNGCPGTILRRNLKAHMARCANAPASCHYVSLGCNKVVTQSNLAAHYTRASDDHLRLLESKLLNVEKVCFERVADMEARLNGENGVSVAAGTTNDVEEQSVIDIEDEEPEDTTSA